MEGDLTLYEHTIQYTDDALWKFTPENYIMLLTNVTTIHSIKIYLLKLYSSFYFTFYTYNFKLTLNKKL